MSLADGSPTRVDWPAEVAFPGTEDQLGTGMCAVHVAAYAMGAVSVGFQVERLFANVGPHADPGEVVLASPVPAGPHLEGFTGAVVVLAPAAAVMRYLAWAGRVVPGWYVLTDYWTRVNTFSPMFAPAEVTADLMLFPEGSRAWTWNEKMQGRDTESARERSRVRSKARGAVNTHWPQIMALAQALADARGHLEGNDPAFQTALQSTVAPVDPAGPFRSPDGHW